MASNLLAPPRSLIPAPGRMPSSSLQSFQTQQLGQLMSPGGTAGAGIAAPSPAASALPGTLNKTPMQVSIGNVSNKINDGNVRLNAISKIVAQREAAKKAETAKTLKLPSMVGQFQEAAAGGQYTGTGRAFTNQISVKDTVKIGNAYLRKDAGNAFMQMSNAFKQATGRSLGITQGWRGYDEQVKLYNLYKAGKGNLAAKPGTSTHGAGTAVDMNGYGPPGGPAFKWLQQNAGKFGYKWTGGTFSQVEPWHWDFVG